MLSQYKVYQYITTGKHTMKTPDRQIPSNLSKNMYAQYISIHRDNLTKENYSQNMNKIKWDRENPYLFSWRLGKEWCKNGDWDVWHRVFGSDSVEREMGKSVNSHKNSRKNTEKVLKTLFKTQNTRFTRLKWVARSSRQNTQRQNCEKFAKCFSRLKGLPARESRAEPRKSLCTPCDWTLHSWTSCQN